MHLGIDCHLRDKSLHHADARVVMGDRHGCEAPCFNLTRGESAALGARGQGADSKKGDNHGMQIYARCTRTGRMKKVTPGKYWLWRVWLHYNQKVHFFLMKRIVTVLECTVDKKYFQRTLSPVSIKYFGLCFVFVAL